MSRNDFVINVEDSTAVKRVAYNADEQTVFVTFTNNPSKEYPFEDVSPARFARLVEIGLTKDLSEKSWGKAYNIWLDEFLTEKTIASLDNAFPNIGKLSRKQKQQLQDMLELTISS